MVGKCLCIALFITLQISTVLCRSTGKPYVEEEVLPKDGPTISGVKSQYQIGDDVNVMCSAGPSKPAAALKWYINWYKAPKKFEIRYHPIRQPDGLLISELGLRFTVKPRHFLEGTTKLQCFAYISLAYSIVSEEIIAENKAVTSEFTTSPVVNENVKEFNETLLGEFTTSPAFDENVKELNQTLVGGTMRSDDWIDESKYVPYNSTGTSFDVYAILGIIYGLFAVHSLILGGILIYCRKKGPKIGYVATSNFGQQVAVVLSKRGCVLRGNIGEQV